MKFRYYFQQNIIPFITKLVAFKATITETYRRIPW